MAKDETKLQVQLKIDKIKDNGIYEVLEAADNKSDFIKDALFHFIHLIEKGSIVNRNYPYKKLDIVIPEVEDEDKAVIFNQEEYEEEYEEEYIEEEYEEEEEYYHESNFDVI